MEQSKLTSKCHICEQEISYYNFKAHFLECDQKHDCEKCGKIFQTENLLRNHKSVHEVNQKESCGKSFSRDGSL